MNVQKLISKMQIRGIDLCMDEGILRAYSNEPLNDSQRQYLKHHKIEILKHLADMSAANQSRKRYSYRFTLMDNKGAGTFITDSPPAKAKQELIDKFIGRELETLDLLN